MYGSQPVSEATNHGRNTDVSNHLQRERRSKHGTGLSAGKIISQQRQSDRRKAGTSEGNDLCRKQVSVVFVLKRRDHF